MLKFLIATNNPGKVKEFRAILDREAIPFCTPREVGVDLEVEETGQTYAENAQLKAVAFARASGRIALADDSGLEVEALEGRPGVYSARYAGSGKSDADRRAKLLLELAPFPAPRNACFRCVIAVAHPTGEVRLFAGDCPGEIIHEERGAGGFGYDPLFYMPEHARTMAELPEALKNQISHRARALQAAVPYLRELLVSFPSPPE